MGPFVGDSKSLNPNPMAGTMALNPAKKFPEFDGYAVFMNEQLEGMMDEDSLDPRLGRGKQDN